MVGDWGISTPSQRGQSNVLGFVLLIGIVIVSVSSVVIIGTSAISDTQNHMANERAEITLMQLDAEAGTVASNGGRRVLTLPDDAGEEYKLQENTGWLKVIAINRSGSRTEITNVSLGEVTYENGNSKIAYQGGGVWRATNNGGMIISPPDMQYNDGTLILPLVNITGASNLRNEALIEKIDSSSQAVNTSVENPIEDRKINVTIQSDYYHGWGEYFEQRSDSNVSYNHSANIVRAHLVPPPAPVRINAGVVAAGDLELDGAANVDGPVSLGGTTSDEGSISGAVEENQTENRELPTAATKITGADTRLNNQSAPADFSMVESGTYYVTNDDIFSSQTTFNTTNGDIELFVDGDVVAQNAGGGTPEVHIVGDGNVKIYVNGEFAMQGQPTWGDANQVDSFTLYSHEVDRITEFYGVLYTDAISIAGAGGGGPSNTDLQGALISTADEVGATGQVQIAYDSALRNTVLQEVQAEFATITYLHISMSTVQID